jgi:hypothetical protein
MELLDDSATLAEWFLPRLRDAAEVGIHTGRLSTAGMAKVRPGLARVLEGGGRMTIVANAAAEFTDADAVRSLAEAA